MSEIRRFRFVVFLAAISYAVLGSAGFGLGQTNSLEANEKSRPKAPSTKKAGDFGQFMRISKDSRKKPVALQTSITRYIGTNHQGKPILVDLIGVVHVGEQEYYAALNEQFKQYDATLYELVAPEGTRIPKGGRVEEGGANPIAALQMGMKSMLDLEFQLEHIDYTVENFIHADMSPEEFFESMSNNEESVGRMMLNSIGSSMAMQSKGSSAEMGLVMSLFSRDRTKSLRRTMAQQMEDIEAGMAMFRGKDGSTIIEHRNAKAMEVLKREIDAGREKLAIFYGAGHLPDMQKRLLEDFEMKRAGRTWLTAWDLEIKKKSDDSSDTR
jgi:hypothetical protein